MASAISASYSWKKWDEYLGIMHLTNQIHIYPLGRITMQAMSRCHYVDRRGRPLHLVVLDLTPDLRSD